jgi:hypothetical protein
MPRIRRPHEIRLRPRSSTGQIAASHDACRVRARWVSPIEIDQLHAFAFFVNVLSPLWNLEPFRGSVLKRKAGPFFKELQVAVDELIAENAVEVIDFSYKDAEAGSGGALMSAKLRISLAKAETVLRVQRLMPDEMEIAAFLDQLAFVFAEIEPEDRGEAVDVDATYSAPDTNYNRMIDFAEWRDPEIADHSVRAARQLQRYAPKGVSLSRAEELVLYMRLMKRKARAV